MLDRAKRQTVAMLEAARIRLSQLELRQRHSQRAYARLERENAELKSEVRRLRGIVERTTYDD